MKFLKFLAPALLGLCLSCSSNRTVENLEGKWNVTDLEGMKITPSERTPYLGFNTAQSQIYGYTGCNRLTGALDAKSFVKGKTNFSRLASTRMLCPDSPYEAPFFKALGRVGKVRIDNHIMCLTDSAGHTLITLTKE